MLSPCIKVCVIAPATGLCSGCGRTLDEIARWGSMSDDQRAEVMGSLPERLAGAQPAFSSDSRPKG
jgi:predicted Fe-S protein YdhL (DUF1289 family)